MMEQETTIRVCIEGRVQGVWYRGWTVKRAEQLSLSGWVRNRSDGSVEAQFQGPESSVRDMIEACHNGPPVAKVTRVLQIPPGDQDGDDAIVVPGIFRQLPTL